MNLDLNAPIDIETVDCINLQNKSGKNIYQTICILDKLSKIINNKIKKDLDKKLEDFELFNKNNLEEVIENKEQIELSKFYEKLPKSTSLSIQYLLNNKIKIIIR
ncbi:hypothetical protein [Blattabacterium cuenoti]|uniref:hypothetical protein n=1 Tax=Blattabacterium cuenoti TaxID=1653831 RepID=UPI00163C9891|nr:hypothetical protein [Blattabacterium cuenoti]